MMDKKLADAIDAFQGCRFEECLRLSDQLLKKMGKSDKKKTNMPEEQINIMYITRIGSLAATGLLDQANELIKQKFEKPIISSEHSFLFLQICTMALDQRIAQFTNIIECEKDKKKIDINRFVLLSRNFSGLSRIFLKKFMQQKRSQDNLKQIYSEYLQQLDNQKLITYQRDKVIPEYKQLKFQIISMFLDKFIKEYEQAPKNHKKKLDETIHNKIKKSVKELKLKIAIHQGKSELARNLYHKVIEEPLCYPYPYLRSIKNLSTSKQENRSFWAKQYLEIFKNNLNIDSYKPIYAYNCEFINELVKQIDKNLFNLAKPQQIDAESLYKYQPQALSQIQNYYNSIYTELKNYQQKEEQMKKKDFFLISLKNLLLQLINLSVMAKHYEESKNFLFIFKSYFGKTLTFPNQIEQYLAIKEISDEKFINQFRQQNNKWKSDDKLIWLINLQKMFSANIVSDKIENMFEQWDNFYNMYIQNLKNSENQRHLEKGQRYLSDEFLTLAADSVQIFTEKYQISDKTREDCYFYIVSKLQKAIQISPYNADLKLRLIYFYNKLNYNETIIQVCETMDIKAVQFQTIGYLQLKPILYSSLYTVQQTLLIRMLRSYQQNYRQSSEYGYKAIQHLSFDQCEQNLTYHHNIERSYNFLILLYTLYLKNRSTHKSSGKFYLLEILKRINNNKITFNCDFRVFANMLSKDYNVVFADFYGIFNSKEILRNQCALKLAYQEFNQTNQCNIQGITYNWEAKDVYNFSDYQFFQRKLQYKYTGQLNSQKTIKCQIDHYNKITQIRLQVLKLLIKIKKQEIQQCKKQQDNIILKNNQLNQFLSKLTWRNQTKLIPVARAYISEIINSISLMIESITAAKKKVSKPGQRKQICNIIVSQLIDGITDRIKWQERIKIQKEYMNENLLQKQEILERMSKMSSYQFKKHYRVK